MRFLSDAACHFPGGGRLKQKNLGPEYTSGSASYHNQFFGWQLKLKLVDVKSLFTNLPPVRL
ncbi:MAG: hypothetical protein K1Y36_12340 [Blastocatellia bacterium]|nr:hypothetical protein [Blastocatellia bacterium]